MPQIRMGCCCAGPAFTPVNKKCERFFSFVLRTVKGFPPARMSGTGKGEARKPRRVPIDEDVAAIVVITFDLPSASRFLDTVPVGGKCFLFSSV